MATTPAPGSNVSPPFANLPFVVAHPDGQLYLTIQALQFLQTLWTEAQPTPVTVDTLPSNPTQFQRAGIIDSSVPATGNFGHVVAGGGANAVPCYFDGEFWRIG